MVWTMKLPLERLLVMGCLLALPAAATGNWQFAALTGGEGRLHPERGGHGLVLITGNRTGLPGHGHLGAEFNTDTFRLTFDRVRFGDGRLELGLNLAGEAGFAGLLPDYYRKGIRDLERGFWASYLATGASAKFRLPGHQSLELAFGGRRWRFSANNHTSPALILPPDTWIAENRLRYTCWQLEDDPSLRQPQRLFPRVRGLALGLEFGLDLRSRTRPWGARDSLAFFPLDQRNDPALAILLFRQWLRAGWQAAPGFRLQLAQWAFWSHRGDDLTRMRVGGLNPYVVPLAGAPWAAFLASRLVAASLSGHFQVWREVEAGACLDGVAFEDRQRTGHSGGGRIAGIGVLADGRLGAAQLDLRAGWNPGKGGQRSLFIALGYGWE